MENKTIRLTLQDVIGKIVGNELSSVTFVRDYVQFAFDGPVLTAYASDSSPRIKNVRVGGPRLCYARKSDTESKKPGSIPIT
jgi:hypothetical protein